MEHLIELFGRTLSAKGHSPITIRIYVGCLKRFAGFKTSRRFSFQRRPASFASQPYHPNVGDENNQSWSHSAH